MVAVITDQDKQVLLRELARGDVGAEFVCSSASMEPTIAVGESVRVREVLPAELAVGDVVVFNASAGFVLHRVVFIAPGRRWFLHLGDAAVEESPRRAMMSSLMGRVNALPRKRPGPWVYRNVARAWLRSRLQKSRRYFYW